jgi:D-amino-acid dehydrogenase
MREIRTKHAIDYDASQLGTMKVFENQQHFNEELKWMSVYEGQGVDCQELSMTQVLEREPALNDIGARLVGGIFYPGDEAGDAHLFCTRLAELTKDNNAAFKYGVGVTGFTSSGSAVKAVRTTRGDIDGDAYILAAGSYSSVLAKTIGIQLPIRPVKGYSITMAVNDWQGKPKIPVIDEQRHIAITPLGNCIRATGTAEVSGYDTSINQQRIQSLYKYLLETYPSGKPYLDFQQATPWAGLRPYTMDGVPIIGDTAYDNFYLNTGHGHLGWSMALGSGKLIADRIMANKSEMDLKTFKLSRFQ